MYSGNSGRSNWQTAALGGRLPFIQKVYGLLLASVLVAVIAGSVVLATPPATTITNALGQPVAVPLGVVVTSQLSFVIWLALLVMLFLGRAVSRNPVLGGLFLFTFTGICGAWIAPNIWYHTTFQGTPGVVQMAGALTTIMFVALTAYTFVSSKNFSYLGAGLWVAGLGLMAALLLNAFLFHSSWAMTMLAWGILVFASAGVLFDTSRIIHNFGDEDVVPATLSLFIDLLNMFLALLRILGGNRR